jgi:hypothetical protein
MFRDQNGKLSNGRILSFCSFVFACLLSLFTIAMAILGDNAEVVGQVTPLVIAFLTMAGGLKSAQTFGENINKQKEGEQ